VVSARDGVRLTIWVEGRVQGVGFRWWVRSRALELGLTGFAENLADGRVKVVAEGREESCHELLARLDGTAGPAERDAATGPGLSLGPPGRVSRITHRWGEPDGAVSGFQER
jgi:acylphosphatase